MRWAAIHEALAALSAADREDEAELLKAAVRARLVVVNSGAIAPASS